MHDKEKIQALRAFRGDIDVYEDGSVQLRPYHADYETVGGPNWDVALVRLIADQQRVRDKLPRHCCGAWGFGLRSEDRCPGCEAEKDRREAVFAK